MTSHKLRTRRRPGASRCGWRAVDCPRGICSRRVVDEKDPSTGRQPAHELHAVVVDFDRIAVLIEAGDAPLRAAEGELPRHGRMVDNNVHVRLQPDVARHGLSNPCGAVRHCRSTMDLVQPNHGRVGMIHGGRSLDVMRVESSRQPKVNEFWRRSAPDDLLLFGKCLHIL